jgi:flavin-dependent dehydrogenase
MVMRDRFDYFLVQKATEKGAELHEGSKVEKISQTNEGVNVVLSDKRTLNGAILIGADGALGLTARAAGLEKNFYYGVALEAEIPMDSEQVKKYRGDMSFVLGALDEGYGWIFPKKNHLSVGFGGTIKNGNKLHGLYKKLLSWKKLSESEGLAGHPFKFRLNNEDKIVEDRIILIGEAAGLVDYLGGEGIYYAIWSAQLAAPAIEKAIRKNIELLVEYQEEINRKIMPDLLMSKRIADIFYAHPWLVYRMFRMSNKVSKLLFGILTGEKKYRDLKKYADRVQLLMSWMGKKI